MADLSRFPVTARWRPANPDLLQLYSATTPNGVKVSIMLEETGIPYEAHRVDISNGESRGPAFLSLNPNGKIPAIIDPRGPNGRPFGLAESCAILIYLAEKTGMLLSHDAERRYATIQWVIWQVSAMGPMFGQVGYFAKFEGREIEDKRPLAHYVDESKRLLTVLESKLDDGPWIMGADYSIADIATLGMVRNLVGFYGAGELVGFAQFSNVRAWLERGLSRPAVRSGLLVPA